MLYFIFIKRFGYREIMLYVGDGGVYVFQFLVGIVEGRED